MSAQHVVVIGGGVVGSASAYFLSQAGCRVTLLEKGSHGRGCSHGNCGYISPSHILPLTEPGMVGVALRSLFHKDAPFRVRPRLDPALIHWFWRFWRRCNFRDMMQAAEGIHALLSSSMTLYEELVQREGLECEWQKRGLLFVYRDRARLEKFAQVDVMLRDRFNEPARRIDADELAAMEPALLPGLAGAWHYECDAHVRPDRLMASWRKLLESRGVEIRENCSVQKFVAKNGRSAAVATSQGEVAADAFVAALGAWTPQLAHELGARIPIQPGKGYSITMPRPSVCPTYPMLFPEVKVGVTPWQSGYRLGSTMEFAGYDSTIRPERLQILRNGAKQFLRVPYTEEVIEEWCGWRPMTWDSLPIIDRSPRLQNVLVAAGHNMLGLSMATGTGRLVAELLTGSQPHLDPTPYSLKRLQ